MSDSVELLEYNALVETLTNTGVGQTAALKYAAAKYPNAVRQQDAKDEQRENVLEKEEQREIRKLFKAFGFEVYWLSQARNSKVTPGVPDLWCMHRERPIGFWWETKRTEGGRFSEAQLRFREYAERCGVGYGCGDRRDARHHLMRLGLAEMVGDTLEPKRGVR